MKKAIFCFLFSIICSLRINAQVFCEIDTVYKNYSLETGSRVIQTSDDNFVVLSVAGQLGSTAGEAGKFKLTKFDQCGNVLWRSITYDSCNCFSGVVDLFEEKDGCIIFSGNFSRNEGKDIRLYKTSSTGQLFWSVQIGDSTQEYENIRGIRISENKYLFAGSARKSINNIYKAIVIIADTLGHTMFQDSFTTAEGGFYSAYRKAENNIILIGNENTNIFIISIDTFGFIKSKSQFPRLRNFGVNYIEPNEEGTLLFYFASNFSTNQTLFAHLDLEGNLRKDSLYSQYIDLPNVYGKSFINSTINSNYLIPGNKIIMVDSNLNMVWANTYDTIINRRVANYSIISRDSSVVSVGSGFFRTKGIGNLVSDSWLGIKSLSFLAKAINIIGPNVISMNNGSIQLRAQVMPETAINKNVQWDVDDTSKAMVSQSGLVTAKSNGIITITASCKDGSNMKATHIVSIMNQGVGIINNEILEQDILTYPNPANSSVTIESKSIQMKGISLYTRTGSMLRKINLQSVNSNYYILDAEDLLNGFYLLQIDGFNEVYFQKLFIHK